jgi:hypothetical protein
VNCGVVGDAGGNAGRMPFDFAQDKPALPVLLRVELATVAGQMPDLAGCGVVGTLWAKEWEKDNAETHPSSVRVFERARRIAERRLRGQTDCFAGCWD